MASLCHPEQNSTQNYPRTKPQTLKVLYREQSKHALSAQQLISCLYSKAQKYFQELHQLGRSNQQSEVTTDRMGEKSLIVIQL